jgi:hypothetical protein
MTEVNDCTPVSWLRLERYALGELDEGERADIAAHLATCARCRACALQLAGDAARALPPLPAMAARAVPRARAWFWRPRFALALVTGLALGVGVWLLRPGQPTTVDGARVVAVKGGDVAVELVRERAGSIAWEPTSFASGDRFKLLLTCAPPLTVHADIVVVQNDGPAFVGEPAQVACGNRVPVPTPFRITGAGAARVCVLLDAAGPPARALLPDGTPPASVAHACVSLSQAD